jgi:GAF domain-containing protein/HAMP domain-containing protein
MSQATPIPERRFRGKLARTMLLVLLPLSLVPLLVLGGTIYLRARGLLTDQIKDQLSLNISSLAEQTDEWLSTRRIRIELLTRRPDFVAALDNLLEIPDSKDTSFEEIRQLTLDEFQITNLAGGIRAFNHFAILTPDGEILASTKPDWEGNNLAQTNYFSELSANPISIVSYAPEGLYQDRIVILTSQPYLSANGEQAATLLGISEPSSFIYLIQSVTQYHPAARSYFITGENQYIGIDPVTFDLEPITPSTEQDASISPLRNLHIYAQSQEPYKVVEFTSYDQELVLASYTWLPHLAAGVVIEFPQNVVLGQLESLAPFSIALFLGAAILLGVLIWRGTQRIVQPLLEVSNTARYFAEGDWQRRANIERNDEIGLLAHSFNQMANELSSVYRSLETTVDSRTEQVRAASEVAQLATSAASLDEVLQQTVKLIVNRFGHYNAAIYLLDSTGDKVMLRESASKLTDLTKAAAQQYAVGSRSIIGWVAANNRSWVAPDVSQDPFYLPDESLPETRSKVALPLSVGDDVLGVLDVESVQLNTFQESDVATLQTLADQIAAAIQNVRLLEAVQIDLRSTSLLYRTSHDIAEAETTDEILRVLSLTLLQVPYSSALFSVERNALQGISLIDHQEETKTKEPPRLVISSEDISHLFSEASKLLITTVDKATNIPIPLVKLVNNLHCTHFAMFPIIHGGGLSGLLLLATNQDDTLTTTSLEPYSSLLEMISTALEKVNALHAITQRLNELQTLNNISQSISTETSLIGLYRIIHEQISQVMGKVNFIIARYISEDNTIEIPYMDDGEEIISVPPFPMGEGLTSIIIRTRQPLMIVEDTINRSQALGAKVLGDPAKSWMGVPLLVGGDIIGALIVQDVENEHRFDDDDLRLLSTLAGQVAAAIRNAQMIEETQKRAERDHLLYEITSKIRRAVDIDNILVTTASELGKAFNARRAKIEISLVPTVEVDSDNGREKQGEEVSE